MKLGEIIDIYEDYQEEKKPLGKALILQEKQEGLTFILEDLPEAEQIIYGTKRFVCKIIESEYYPKDFIKTFNKRYINKIGRSTSISLDDEDEDTSNYTINDNFIEIDGIQAF